MVKNFLLGIRVHACEKVVYSEICHDDAQEGKGHVDVVGEGLAEQGQALCVNHYGVNHKGDERPGFLGIPTPVVAPAHVCPDCTDEDAEPHRGKGRIEEHTAQRLKLLPMRAEEDSHDAAEEGERQQGVAHHDDADVDAEKGTVENGHHLSDGWIHLVDVAHQEEEAR